MSQSKTAPTHAGRSRRCAQLAAWLCGLVTAGAFAQSAPPAAPAEIYIGNARVFDGRQLRPEPALTLRVSEGRVTAIDPSPPPAGATVIDAGGRIVLPGLIDAHVHPSIPLGFTALRDADPNYVANRAAVEARAMLLRGFTSIRDMGGPSFGLKQAIDEGVLEGPRIFPSGAMISQTSGHGDFRSRDALAQDRGSRDVMEQRGYGAIADGEALVLAAVREQLRQGATQIKLAAGGGLSSMYDPLDSVQYLDGELRAAVRAAEDWGTYVAVHAYTPIAIRRSIEAGVKSIEHAHLIDEPTMRLIAERGIWLSPQAYVFGGAFPMTGKGAPIVAGLDRMMQLAKKYRVKVAFGTDVFGAPRVYGWESLEFGARLRWFTPMEILQQATSINGELLALSGPRNPYASGKLGVLEPGAWADLLIVDGNPLEDLRLLEDPAENLRVIMKGGRIVRNTLP
ncbi:MAG: amidohydrolase family protein [Gammaproteobacteria bacterium]|nr:amidohydrolase family protein [Gammaproteobacteria bacterium]